MMDDEMGITRLPMITFITDEKNLILDDFIEEINAGV